MKLRTAFAILGLTFLTACTAATFHARGIASAAIVFAACDLALAAVLVPRNGMLYVTTNSLGTLAATGVLHEALGLTLKKLPFLRNMVSDFGPGMAQQNTPFNVSQILKNWNVTHTVSSRSSTGTYAKQAGVTPPSDQTFVMDKWPYVSFLLTGTEINQLVDGVSNSDVRAKIIQKLMTLAFNKLGTQIVTDFYAAIDAVNAAAGFSYNYAFPAATGDYKKLGSAVDVMLSHDGLDEPPVAILDITPFRTLANSLTPVANSSFSIDEIMRTGEIPGGISGTKSVNRYNVTMPTTCANGFLMHPAAMVCANRVPYEERTQNDPVYLEVITDPATGFSMLYREAKDPLTGEVTRTLTTMYGFALGLDNHFVRLTES